jgi:hypothetical protein
MNFIDGYRASLWGDFCRHQNFNTKASIYQGNSRKLIKSRKVWTRKGLDLIFFGKMALKIVEWMGF